MIDPNVYALSIELQLNTTKAFSSLDQFESKLLSIEEQVSTSAQKALGSIQNIIVEVEKSLIGINTNLKDINKSSIDIQTNFSKAAKDVNNSFESSTEQLKNLKKELESLRDISETYDKVHKNITEISNKNNDFLKGIKDIVKAIDLKNQGHIEQNQLMKDGDDVLKGSVQQAYQFSQNVHQGTHAWRQAANALRNIVKILYDADAASEQFVTTNYRVYGSQMQLAQSTRSLSMELGVSAKHSIETYKALTDLSVPRNEIDRYARMVAIANRTTGAGIPLLAMYAKRLSVVGFSTAEVEKQTIHMNESMRKFGLNTSDINSLLGSTASQAIKVKSIFGGNKEAVDQWNQMRIVVAGFGQQIGQTAGELDSFYSHLLNDISAMEVFKSFTNTTEQGMDGMRLATLRAGLAIDKQMSAYEALVNARKMDVTTMNAERAALIRTYFAGNEAAFEASRQLGRQAKQLNLTGKNIGEFNQLAKNLANTQRTLLSEANEHLYAQLNKLSAMWEANKDTILAFVVEGLAWVVWGLNGVLETIGYVITKFIKFQEWLEASIPGYKYFRTALKVLTAAFLVFIGVVLSWSAVAAVFTKGAVLIGSAITGMFTLITAVGNALLAMATVFGQIIIVIFRSIGQAIGAFGVALAPAVIPLLGFSLALLLGATAAYMLAKAINVAKLAGDDMISVAMKLAGSMIILGVALGILAVGASFLAPGLLVVSVSLLAVGAAAFLVGLGMLYAGKGIDLLSKALDENAIDKIAGLAWPMMKLGAAGLIAAPGLYALGSSISTISNALNNMAAVTVSTKIADDVSTIADKLIDSTTKFNQSGIQLESAGKLLISGSKALESGINAIATVSKAIPDDLIVISEKLLSVITKLEASGSQLSTIGKTIIEGSTTLASSGETLKISSQTIVDSGALLIKGGEALYNGIRILSLSIPMMIAVGMGLLTSALILSLGVSSLFPAVLAMTAIGALVIISGLEIFTGATYLNNGALLLQSAGGTLYSSSSILLQSSFMISTAISNLILAGLGMTTAAASLIFGMYWLNSAIERSAGAISKINLVALTYASLAYALNLFKSISLSGLKDFSQEARVILPNIVQIADDLNSASSALTISVDKFQDPVVRLTSLLNDLSTSIVQFAGGTNIGGVIAPMVSALESYADLLENVIDRIEVALLTKAIPAIKAVQESGLDQIIKSEAISTVQVMDKREGTENDADDNDIPQQTLSTLALINEKLGNMSNDVVSDILSVLKQYLPDMAEERSDLSNKFNSWNG